MSTRAGPEPSPWRAATRLGLLAVALAVLAAGLSGATGYLAPLVAAAVVLPTPALLGPPRRWRAADGGWRRPRWAAAAALAVVGSAGLPVALAARASAASTRWAWTVTALVVLAAAAALAQGVPTRSRATGLLALSVAMAGVAGSYPSTAFPGAVLVLWLAAALASLVASARSPGSLRPLSPVAAAGARSRRRAALQAAGVGLAVVVLAPAIAAVIGTREATSRPSSDGDDAGEAGRTTGEEVRYGTYADSLDTSDRFELGDAVVMRVRAPAVDFWRGQSFDTFDGRVWTNEGGSPPRTGGLGVGNPAPRLVPFALGDVPVAGERFVQTFTVVQPGAEVVFAAYRPSAVWFASGDLLAYDDGTLRRTGADPWRTGAVYTVESRRQPVTAELLRVADPRRTGLPAAIADRYLALPEVPARVRALADELAAGRASTYDVVRSMERWMDANVRYSLDIPPLPAGADAVEHLLFVDRVGFCEQIASALAVMLRTQGIPARLATGYAGGELNGVTGDIVVRERDAHAWVEVWFPGVGWQAFDPTASIPLAGERPSGWAARLRALWASARPWLAAAALVAVVAGLGWAVAAVHAARRRRARRPWVDVQLGRLEQLGASGGRPRARSETPAEYARALAAGALAAGAGDPVAADLDAVGSALTRAAYAPGGIALEERRAVEAAIDRVRRARRTARRRRGRRRYRARP